MVLGFRDRMASARRRDAALALTIAARAVLGADDNTVVSVSEHDCGDPECGGARTTILVMRPGHPTEAVKLNKPLDVVTRADLAGTLARSPPAKREPDTPERST
jgi:hypothetical protein